MPKELFKDYQFNYSLSIPKITINLVVYNGEKYIHQCLDSVLAQTYPHESIELNILDNASTDSTVEKIRLWTMDYGLWQFSNPDSNLDRPPSISHSLSSGFSLIQSAKNLGMWPGQEELLKNSHGKYVVVLSVDVILDKDFIKNAIEAMEHNPHIGALQAKVYKYELADLHAYDLTHLRADVIDTLGFQIFRSRRIVNIGHGEIDHGQYDQEREIFAVEGAVPVFRRQTLEDCRLRSQLLKLSSNRLLELSFNRGGLNKGGAIVDPNFFWYGDDLDLAWRVRLFGWKQVYSPRVIAWHDRKTTKALADGWKEFIKIRRTVPMFKRRLDWRNTTLTIIKNDFTFNLLRDLPYILWRQLRLWAYFLFFEPAMFLEIFNVAKMLPKMLKRRREIMQKAKISAKDFRQWIH